MSKLMRVHEIYIYIKYVIMVYANTCRHAHSLSLFLSLFHSFFLSLSLSLSLTSTLKAGGVEYADYTSADG